MIKLLFCCVIISLVIPRCALSGICSSKVCEFTLTVHYTRTMVYKPPGGDAYDVHLNGTRLYVKGNAFRQPPADILGRPVEPHGVITGDGRKRNIIAINGQFPGPTLEVMEGSQVLVHVINKLMTSAVTIHWHGLYQRGNGWMDGVPYVTQCPILPHQHFTYRFMAEPAGTHWYHSHFSTQRLDGLQGMFIVHSQPPELPYHLLSVTDWHLEEARTLPIVSPFNKDPHMAGTGELYFLDHPVREYTADGIEVTAIRFSSALINGRGRHDEKPYPLSDFSVQNGISYRFRVLNSAAEYAFELSIDNHPMTLVALDGFEIKPLTVDSLILYPGERIDLIILTNFREGSTHWIRAESLRIGKGRFKVPDPNHDGVVYDAKAILSYTGGNNISFTEDPTTAKTLCSHASPCKVFNCPFLYYPRSQYKECLTLADAFSPSAKLYNSETTELFFNFGFNFGSSINGRRFLGPLSPLFENRSALVPCPERCEHGCLCTQTVTIGYNRTYQFVLSNYQPENIYMGHHPIHIHGHSFSVVKIGYPKYNLTTGRIIQHNTDITCPDALCAKAQWTKGVPNLNLKNPPLKDTVVVPSGGYVVIQLKTVNPGLWLMHCHSETHNEEGMSLILDIAPERHSALPPGFPTCTDFRWSEEDFSLHLNSKRKGKRQLVQSDTCTLYVKFQLLLRITDLIGIFVSRLTLGTAMTSLPILLYRGCLYYRPHQNTRADQH